MNSICVFSVSEIKSPPDDFEGHTNIESFWELVTQEMVGRGFLRSKLFFIIIIIIIMVDSLFLLLIVIVLLVNLCAAQCGC